MQAQIKPTMTPEEYLRQERKAPFKSEYYAGEVFAMAGASPRHVLITTNTAASLVPQLKGRPCFVFTADLRVKVSAARLYTYPDVVVVCGRPRYEDRQKDTLLIRLFLSRCFPTRPRLMIAVRSSGCIALRVAD